MSATITGKVISIDLETTAKGQKGEYPAWELIYKNGFGEVKTITKHLNGIKYNKPLANGLADLKAGDDFTMEQEKNEGGYWEPKLAYGGIKEAEKTTPQSTNKTPPSTGVNTFEVNNQLKEKQQALDVERQPLIIRQTCLTAATNLATLFKYKTEADVLTQAERFIDFIYKGNNSIVDMVDDEID